MKKYQLPTRFLLAGVTSAALLLGAGQVASAHVDVNLRDAGGALIADATAAYSPKQTCGACHNNPDPDATGARGIYGHGTKSAVKTQGVIEGDNQIYWQSYEVAGFEHGFVVGRHSQQGRNEDYSTEMRTKFGDPFFTSSPGMFGKF